MKKCKWAGDPADEYCKSCDGICMMVEGIEKSCTECNGYEEGTEEVSVESNELPFDTDEPMTQPVKENPVKTTQKAQKTVKDNKVVNTTSKEEKPVKNENTKSQKVEKVAEEKHIEEDKELTPNGIQITSLRYTSSATVKKGDNYYKFTAEEEWSTELYRGDIQDVREQLWAKLNAEVDSQIEELKNM